MSFPKLSIQTQQGQDQNSGLSTISHLVTLPLVKNDPGVACWLNRQLSQTGPAQSAPGCLCAAGNVTPTLLTSRLASLLSCAISSSHW